MHAKRTFFMPASEVSIVENGMVVSDILVIKRSRRYRYAHTVAASIDSKCWPTTARKIGHIELMTESQVWFEAC